VTRFAHDIRDNDRVKELQEIIDAALKAAHRGKPIPTPARSTA
jgi:hypothetical protein